MVHFLIALALCYVLIKIPFWVLGSIRGGHRRSPVGSLIRGFIAYKTFGLLRGGSAGAAASIRAARRGPKPPAPPDPYAKTKATADGQYMIPLPGLKRTRAGRVRPAATLAPKPQRVPAGQQLRLPADGEWPENKPILQRDGQYRLPLQVQRKPRTTAAEPVPLTAEGNGQPSAHRVRRPRVRQQALPLNLPPKRTSSRAVPPPPLNQPHHRRTPPDPRTKGHQP